ncbi:MAG: SAM-dependent methyltransferase [Kutzneria sp.]|nr:SAM-dependent methyltransferase [Kutzneria sp.]
MSDVSSWVPPGANLNTPSVARIYDYLLGGGHNFAVDRQTAVQIQQAMPGLAQAARVNRAFLRRAVLFMVEQGITQFLDIGSGIPTVGNVHEIAQQVNPACRVVYVDKDPVAVAHSQLMLQDNKQTGCVQADMRDPHAIFASAPVKHLLDLNKPVGLLMLLMLHWVPDEAKPLTLMDHYRRQLAPGSYLAITHIGDEHYDQKLDKAAGIVSAKGADQINLRAYEEILPMFGDFTLVEPGLTRCVMWRADGPGAISDNADINTLLYAGVAVKPADAR